MSTKKLTKILAKLGYELKSQKGSHIKLVKYTKQDRQIVIIPNHKIIRKGTLKNIIKHLGLDTEDLVNLLKE